jgi:kinesin family protein 2/24
LTKYVEEHNFTFDLAYDENTSNEVIYLEAVRPMIEAAFNKTKVTCFAYGQTGSGKTFTMMGPGTNALEMGAPGLYLLSAFDIFSYLENEAYNHLEIWVSFYEIYCGKLYDLLNDRTLLTAREDGKQNICIVGLTEKQVNNLGSMMSIIEYGLKARTVGVTGANSDSSRSHGIIQISIKEPNGNSHGKISFIDLAGSERAADTIDTNKQTRIDGAEINKSLLALKECIRALDQDKKHTPFRGSKLTLVLRDSFVGNCKTLMIANISPGLSSSEHTLNTLRYADRVKELKGVKEKECGKEFKDVEREKDPQEILANLLMMPRQHSINYILKKLNFR